MSSAPDVDAIYLEAHARLETGEPLEPHHERVIALMDHAAGCSSCYPQREEGESSA